MENESGKTAKRDFKFYKKLFFSVLYISTFTIGGGYIIIPMMRKKFVKAYHWIEEDEMLDMAAIAQSTPGSSSANASLLVGYRVAGIPGALIALLGTLLPPLIILSAISFFYIAFESNEIVKAVLKGMEAGVAAVIVDVVIKLGGKVLKKKDAVSDIIMVSAFIASYFFNVNVAIIILICGALGAVSTVVKTGKVSGI